MTARGSCPHCGQPIGADGGVCPSCGRAPTSRAAPAPSAAASASASADRTARTQLRGEVFQLLGFLFMFAPLAIGVGLIALGVFNLLILLPAMLIAAGIGALLWRAG